MSLKIRNMAGEEVEVPELEAYLRRGTEHPIDHLTRCGGCEWCTALMENGWQTCEGCGRWGNDMLSIPHGLALCSSCAEDPAYATS